MYARNCKITRISHTYGNICARYNIPFYHELFVPDGVKAAAEIESSTPFDQRVFDVLNLKAASEPSVEVPVDVGESAAVTAHRNSV